MNKFKDFKHNIYIFSSVVAFINLKKFVTKTLKTISVFLFYFYYFNYIYIIFNFYIIYNII